MGYLLRTHNFILYLHALAVIKGLLRIAKLMSYLNSSILALTYISTITFFQILHGLHILSNIIRVSSTNADPMIIPFLLTIMLVISMLTTFFVSLLIAEFHTFSSLLPMLSTSYFNLALLLLSICLILQLICFVFF